MDKKTFSLIASVQKKEITDHFIYLGLAKKAGKNKKILEQIARHELRHYNYWKSSTKMDVKPSPLRVYFYVLLSSIFGISFGLKIMEKGESADQIVYSRLSDKFKGIKVILKDEKYHEKEVANLLSDERLEYASSIVLGLNDALVELTGALSGLTLALHGTRIVALTGLIVGFAASLSMAASGYLSSKEENGNKIPIKSALYTGITYFSTVILLVLPYFLIDNLFTALVAMLLIALSIIFAYTFYITTAKGLKFWRRLAEMASISLAVALISFVAGWVIRIYFNA